METISSEMLRGHVDTVILLTLLNEHKHTNQIKEEIEARVGGEFKLKQGTFYSCLQRIVNQGYVVEYRSTSADGKRRKFYQLTEKGKAYINDNKDKWIFSRSVIDNLIQVPSTPFEEKTESQPLKQSYTEDFSSVTDENVDSEPEIAVTSDENTNTAQNIIAEDKFDSEPEYDDAFTKENNVSFEEVKESSDVDNSNSTTKSKLKLLEEYLSSQSVEVTDKEEFLSPKTPVTPDNDNDLKINQSFNQELFKKMQIDAENKAQQNLQNERNNSVEITSKIEENISNNLHNYVSEQDDFYDGEEQISSNYRNALLKIFPKKAKTENHQSNRSNYDIPTENDAPFEQNEKHDNVGKQNKFFRFDNGSTANNQAPQRNNVNKRENVREESIKKPAQNNQNVNSFDFSEIYALAQREGFKVRTSSTSLKNDIGKIFINKLVLNSALTFYLFVLIEIAVLALTTRTVANIDYKVYIAIALIFAILPLGALFSYVIDPKRKIDNLIPFKSVIEFSFIVMLNLIIIVFVVAIVKNIDFTNSRDLLLNIFYPLLAIINIPIYYFIKYLKLDNQKYYS